MRISTDSQVGKTLYQIMFQFLKVGFCPKKSHLKNTWKSKNKTKHGRVTWLVYHWGFWWFCKVKYVVTKGCWFRFPRYVCRDIRKDINAKRTTKNSLTTLKNSLTISHGADAHNNIVTATIYCLLSSKHYVKYFKYTFLFINKPRDIMMSQKS